MTKFSTEGLQAFEPMERSVLLENHLALRRRWDIARNLDGYDPRTIDVLFPRQRELLSTLAVLSEDEVNKAADVLVPLFRVGAIPSPGDVLIGHLEVSQVPQERENHYELLEALHARQLAAVRDSAAAAITYHMLPADLRKLGTYASHQLRWLALQPWATLYPIVPVTYFMQAAFNGVWTRRDRMRFAACSRSVVA